MAKPSTAKPPLSSNASGVIELKAKTFEIPHPNRDSNFFDRIMSSGQYDPIKNDMVVKTEVQNHSLKYWTKNVLSPQSSSAIEKQSLQNVPTFKKRMLRESNYHSSTVNLEESVIEEDEHQKTMKQLMHCITGNQYAQLPKYYKSIRE